MEPTRLCLIWRNISARVQHCLQDLAERKCAERYSYTPEEEQLLASLWAEREKELQEIDETVRTFMAVYPSLRPSNFSIPETLPSQAFWLAYHALMLLAERASNHASGQPELVSIRFTAEGSMLINGTFTIPAQTVRDEVFRLVGQQIPEVDQAVSSQLVCWLSAAGQKHAPLFDPQFSQRDPADQSDFLAAWRVS